MEFFNERVRRIANLRAYGMCPEDIIKQVDASETELRLLVVAADMFAEFTGTERTEPVSPISGEFEAR